MRWLWLPGFMIAAATLSDQRGVKRSYLPGETARQPGGWLTGRNIIEPRKRGANEAVRCVGNW